MSVSGLFNIGLTDLQTTNQLLSITGHNIANANTPGYTREEAILESIPGGTIVTSGAAGNGVEITEVQRMYNSFINSQLNAENSNLSYWNNYQTGISQVQDIFNEASTTGITPAITQFFTDWQNVAQSPQDQAERTTLIQDAGYLSSRLNTASASLQSERSQLLSDSQSLTNQVNIYTAQIADLNAKIGGNTGALDLEDQRDNIVSELNKIVKVSAYKASSGNMTVMLGGTALVGGVKTFSLSANSDVNNNMHFYVEMQPGAAQGSDLNPDVTSLVTGGQLKADLDLRDSKIPAYLNQLNAFAVDLADSTNYYQKQGYGLDGSPGGNLFQPLSLQAKYTSVDSVNGVFTSPADTFTNGGTLTIKLGDNDAKPATVTVTAGATLADVVNDINTQAGLKVTAAVVNSGPAGSFAIGNSTIITDKGGALNDISGGIYTGAGLATAINGIAGLGINVAYDSTANNFTITSTAGANGATKVLSTSTIGTLLGIKFNGSPTIGTGLTGSAPAPADYRISIKSDGNLGDVRISAATADGNGSGLNLLATGPIISSMSVTDPNSVVSNAQYKIDYVNGATYGSLAPAVQAGYQLENTSDYYTIDSTNNKVQINGATVTIPTGSYTGPQLAAALQTQLQALNSNATIAYDNTSGKFTITNNPLVIPAVGATNNKINFTVTGGANAGTYTATIQAGTYNTAADVQAAILDALNNHATNDAGGAAWAGPAWTAGPAVAGQLDITNNTGGAVTFNWGASNATPQEFGYTAAGNQVANGSSLASTNNTLTFDWGNTLNFTVGGKNYTATLNPQAYTSGTALATEIANEMNSSLGIPGTFTGTVVGNAICITNTLGTSTPVNINWANSSATYQKLGFNLAQDTIAAAAGSNITAAGAPSAPTSSANMFGFLNSDAPISVSMGGAGSASTSDYGISGSYWRVLESTDGNTWTAINPNTAYDQSNPTTINQTEVNLTTDTTGSFSRTLGFQGVKVQIDGDLNQANSNGGTFAVQLDPNAASDIKTVFTDPAKVAASTDMFTVDSTNNTVVFNVNGGANITATIPAGSYTNDPGQSDDISSALTTAIQEAYQSATGSSLPDTLNVVFNPNTKQFKIMMPSGSDTVNLLWSSNSAATANQIFGFSSDATVTAIQSAVSDNPASVLSSANKGVPGDGRNATTIAELASGNAFGGSTPVDFYNSLVSNVGVNASSAANSLQYETNMVAQLTQRQSEVSGVSMDQEAANLVIYQKAYQAAAQMITVANSLLTTLIQMVSSGTMG
ncbi:MAG: flagellar hook-associated protein FlgK [Nitrospirae bacterium]|nr:flagellar hook-associated protein FlgK [Nitrospirota bacterium]